ncbi:MAG: hypothetical protein KC505_03470, partial [Myxococcales bacterium]|nr:hypothetical protein [Myxococcales bacterium]
MFIRIQKKTLWLWLLITFACSSAFVLVTQNLWRELSDKQAQAQKIEISSWAPLVEKSQPAVVVITTEALVQQPAMEFPGLPGPFRFFPPEKQRGQGSGFIINEDGYIIT